MSKDKALNRGDLIRAMDNEALAKVMLTVEDIAERVPFCHGCDEDICDSSDSSQCLLCLIKYLDSPAEVA